MSRCFACHVFRVSTIPIKEQQNVKNVQKIPTPTAASDRHALLAFLVDLQKQAALDAATAIQVST
jgi:hypothetical protein